jgi:DNA topoisomerase I
MKNLVIVESPAKAKTIEKYLGSDFRVLSSVGHIRDIAKKAVKGQPPIDTKNGFKTIFEIDPDKKKIITELKKAVKDSQKVWLATDEDREGEAIAWHLCEVLKLDPKSTKRIVFHEITKDAITQAVANPRTVDMNLVQAQQARQILDRLVGFELSPIVWRKVPGGKSAGRVQSPAVRLIVEREREIEAFQASSNYKISAEFTHEGDTLKAEVPKKFDSSQSATEFLQSLIGARYHVSDISKTPGVRNPGAPYTTSTLQQDASSRLGFSAKSTMSSAQRLYQQGKITYMRTDSVNLSTQAIGSIASFIQSQYGKDYSQVRTFKTKNASAQEAHEAIRPTDIRQEIGSTNEYDQKLYDLIRRRTLASQMSPAKLEKTVITIKVIGDVSDKIFEAKGEVIIFDGFLKAYRWGGKDSTILPALKQNDPLDLISAEAHQIFAKPPARYTEGSLVKKLEELGIGRPSTYATILNTIQVRGYVEKGMGEGAERPTNVITLQNDAITDQTVIEKTGADKGKLVPTAIGEVISDFLTGYFQTVVDYGFTAKVELDFDKIAAGSLARNVMLEEFYKPFHELVAKSDDIDRSSVSKTREVGIDPKTNQVILARFGRFGPMLQLGSGEGEAKPQFAPMPTGYKVELITLEAALKAFELPRAVGETANGDVIKANVGRFGPYIQIGKLFISIKPFDPNTITLEQALDLYQAKLKAEAEKNILDFGDGIKILNGRFGPYVTDGTKNAKIAKETDPKTITHDVAKDMLAKASKNPRRRFFKPKNGKK